MDATLAAPSWRPYSRAGYLLILFTFGVLGGGACVTRIGSAVVGTATVSGSGSRKVVQHLEGGIVAALLAREGETVAAGQPLIRLSDVAARADMALLQGQLTALLATEARLVAERDHAAEITWPDALKQMPDQALVAQTMADQAAQFRDRRRSLDGQAEILRARIEKTRMEIDGIRVERGSDETQLSYIKTELAGVSELLKQKLVEVARVLALKREQARLEGGVGRLITDEAGSGRAITETELEIRQLTEHFQEDVAASLADTRRQIDEVRGKLRIAQDVLARTVITAPIAGAVQGVRVGGPGQVVRPGEPLLEIVPAHDRLQIDAHFRPTDIADLHPGQDAEVRFPAFPSRGLPLILGRVDSISGDILTDEETHQPYFLGIVSVGADSLPAPLAGRLHPGMPAEVIVPTGERSVMSYLTDPLAHALRGTFVEK